MACSQKNRLKEQKVEIVQIFRERAIWPFIMSLPPTASLIVLNFFFFFFDECEEIGLIRLKTKICPELLKLTIFKIPLFIQWFKFQD